MTEQITRVFEHDDFAIWHVPQANGYVYEAAGIVVDEHSYEDCPFEATYEDALNAACELYDVEVGSLSQPLPVVYANTVFKVYETPAGEFLYALCDDEFADHPTPQQPKIALRCCFKFYRPSAPTMSFMRNFAF